jgi:hypothetical protein
MMYGPQGGREVGQAVLITALCTLVSEAIIVGADLIRRKAGVWRCPECNRTPGQPAPPKTEEPTPEQKPKKRKKGGAKNAS